MGKRIMVVDDETDTRELVKMILETSGFEVQEAENGDDCLKKVDSNVSVILLDVMMPGTPPKKVVEEISKKSDLEKIKIIYFTVLEFSEDEKKKVFIGQVVDYIQKPFEKGVLLEKIRRAAQ